MRGGDAVDAIDADDAYADVDADVDADDADAGELEKSGLCSSVLGGGGKKKKKKRRHRTIFTSYQVRRI